MQELKDIAATAKASTAKLEAHVNATNEQIAATLRELQAATVGLTTQVANITSELTAVSQILKNMQDKIDNAELSKVAPASKILRTDETAAAGSC